MPAATSLGIDYGDLDIQAMCASDASPVALDIATTATVPVLLFDPTGNLCQLGVSFPSLYQNIGVARSLSFGGVLETADAIIGRRLSAIAREVKRVCGEMATTTTIAVSTAMTQSRRAALLECAELAGIGNVTLIDRCTAAALAYQGNRDRGATYLIYSLGYGDCEYAVARIAGDRRRILASGIVQGVSGQLFDAMVIEAIVQALQKQRIFIGLGHLTPEQWNDFQRIAESARKRLGLEQQVEFELPTSLTRLREPLGLRIRAARFSDLIAPLIDQTVEALQAALEHNKLERSDVDGTVVIGDVAQEPLVYHLLCQRLGSTPFRADPMLVARGALAHATHEKQHTSDTDLSPVAPLVEQATLAPAPAALPGDHSSDNRDLIEVISGLPRARVEMSQPASPSLPLARPTTTALARELIDAGDLSGARAALDAIQAEVTSLYAELSRRAPGGPLSIIQRAQALLRGAKLVEAVSLSHQAYQLAPDDPEVFAAMMKIHVDAGMAMDKPEEFAASANILRCALSHDQTDRTIQKALAERNYRHGLAMRQLNNITLAIEALNRSLLFDPKHAGANALLLELSAG